MYIRKVEKKNKGLDKSYVYYRLVHGYKIGNKVRQQTLLNLGKLEGFPKSKLKVLADCIEVLLTGSKPLFDVFDQEVESLAAGFVSEIQSKGLFPSRKRKTEIGSIPEQTYQQVDIDSIEEESSVDIGGEWLCSQTFKHLGLRLILAKSGMTESQIDMALILLTSKLIHPSSEKETERWLKENSGAMELYGEEGFSVTRYRLYQAATTLYGSK